MATIHPAPADVYLRPSSEGGEMIDICVRTAAGGFEVQLMSDEKAASWLKILAHHIERRFRDRGGILR